MNHRKERLCRSGALLGGVIRYTLDHNKRRPRARCANSGELPGPRPTLQRSAELMHSIVPPIPVAQDDPAPDLLFSLLERGAAR